LISGNAVSARPVSNHPLRAGEFEAITWMSFDSQDGVDYGRVAYTRRPSGEPVFGEPELFAVEIRPSDDTPGRTLLRAFLEDEQTQMDVERVLARGGVIERGSPIGPLRLVRLRQPITFGCIRCGSEHRARSVGVVEDRELICKACYLLLARRERHKGP
jgi:hypothetical protein